MSTFCKDCNEELSSDYEGELSEGTLCPQCGKPLVRAFTLYAEAAHFELTGGDVELIHRTYPEALLEEVVDLISRNKFTLAVVVAQMACEISVERALARAFVDRDVDFLSDAVTKMLSGRSITNGNVRKVYDALAGKDTLTDLQSVGIWDGLTEMNKWRNAAVHRGETFTKTEADTALNTATELVKYFKL